MTLRVGVTYSRPTERQVKKTAATAATTGAGDANGSEDVRPDAVSDGGGAGEEGEVDAGKRRGWMSSWRISGGGGGGGGGSGDGGGGDGKLVAYTTSTGVPQQGDVMRVGGRTGER